MRTIGFALAALLIGSAAQGQGGKLPTEIRGRQLFVEGHKFTVKGLHYSPWRKGTGPAKGYAYPGPEAIESDFRLIRTLNVNTILVIDPPGYVLDLAGKYGLKVLYGFYLNWWTLGTPEASATRDSILQRVHKFRDKPALLGWVLGNEIPLSAIEQRGEGVIESGLEELYRSLKAIDPSHPVTHSNWPTGRALNLQFLDIVSFNLYPLWPPEVVAMGFDRYIERVLKPIAAGKPLLISEFGANSLEAGEEGQARLIGQCWRDLMKAGACGGVVFGFADEWWKNYDNPRRAESYWERKLAPDDETTHDRDPEEYYGIVDADRRPKSAFRVVQAMYAPGKSLLTGLVRIFPIAMISLLVLLAGGGWVWAARKTRLGPSGAARPMPRQRG